MGARLQDLKGALLNTVALNVHFPTSELQGTHSGHRASGHNHQALRGAAQRRGLTAASGASLPAPATPLSDVAFLVAGGFSATEVRATVVQPLQSCAGAQKAVFLYASPAPQQVSPWQVSGTLPATPVCGTSASFSPHTPSQRGDAALGEEAGALSSLFLLGHSLGLQAAAVPCTCYSYIPFCKM